jgi:ketopantoate reductase
MINDPVIVVGIGEMGGVFTRGLLRLGHPVFPVTRNTDMEKMARAMPDPRLVLVSVGEDDLQPTLERIPASWKSRLGLLQNELLPGDWKQHDIENPTVISVWFEKKKGQDFKVLIPSPVFGPQAPLLENALATLDIPTWEVASGDDIEYELVRKNVYILTTNIAGLVTGGSVEELWDQHQDLARQVADEVMDIQAWLVGHHLEREKLIEGMVEGIKGDLQHQCMGRSAPKRLARALQFADQAGLKVAKLREIQSKHT